jgi:uncharacterized protein YjbJ (UPF0337 family)
MNKDNFEGGVRSAVGPGERFVGSATDDKASEVRGAYNEVAGSAQSVPRTRRKIWGIPVRFLTCPVCARTSQS